MSSKKNGAYDINSYLTFGKSIKYINNVCITIIKDINIQNQFLYLSFYDILKDNIIIPIE
jgi:hypothetical protein